MADAQYDVLHSDVAGAELIELPPGSTVPHLCNIVLMRGAVAFSDASAKALAGSLPAVADSEKVRSLNDAVKSLCCCAMRERASILS